MKAIEERDKRASDEDEIRIIFPYKLNLHKRRNRATSWDILKFLANKHVLLPSNIRIAN
jgi:hypothetical protein